jgi:hypothetical protein
MGITMSDNASFEAIPIGFELGPLELVLDEFFVNERLELVQWEDRTLVSQHHIVPPGATIFKHAVMKFDALPDMKVSIWAKSEHEFLQPMAVGSTVFIYGRIVDKYVKRGRNYMVTECETRDKSGQVLMKSRETAVYVE